MSQIIFLVCLLTLLNILPFIMLTFAHLYYYWFWFVRYLEECFSYSKITYLKNFPIFYSIIFITNLILLNLLLSKGWFGIMKLGDDIISLHELPIYWISFFLLTDWKYFLHYIKFLCVLWFLFCSTDLLVHSLIIANYFNCSNNIIYFNFGRLTSLHYFFFFHRFFYFWWGLFCEV